MYKNILVIFILSIQVFSYAQKKDHELGFFAGIAYYMGDVNPEKLFYSVDPAIGFIYKFDINSRYNMRFNATFSGLRGSDSDSKNTYQQVRNHSFNIPLTELSSSIEFNFFPYKPESRFEYLSPYITAGLGLMIIPSPENSIPIHAVIPFGLGFKYAFNKRFGISAEWAYRITFTDYIDQLPDDEYTQIPAPQNKQRSYTSSKDWYSFAGISLTYKFALGSSKCPAYRN
jgi:long-subunit fatty acid transport protein